MGGACYTAQVCRAASKLGSYFLDTLSDNVSVITGDGRVIVVRMNGKTNQFFNLITLLHYVIFSHTLELMFSYILHLFPPTFPPPVCGPSLASVPSHLCQGVLKGFDQTVNMILAQSHERVYSSGAGVEKVQLGLYIIRGDNM